jgi:hypothetical protein
LIEALRLFPHGSSEIVVDNNLNTPIKKTISEFPSGKQSESFHQHNNLTVPIKATLGGSEIVFLIGVLRLLS